MADYIRQCWQNRIPLADRFHKRATRLVREYMLVGGMPQSVVAYLENDKDFAAADASKRMILNLYEGDIKKAAGRYRSRVAALFEEIPGYLSTHEKKVILSKVEEGSTFARFDEPLFWLGDTGLLVSLAFSENELATMQLYREIISGRLSLNEGMLHENLVAQTLAAKGKKLYFYTRYSEAKHRNDVEVDFLVSNDSKLNHKVTPIEVKSSKNYSTTSYDTFKKLYRERVGESYVIHPKAFSASDEGYRVPTYMGFCLFE